MARRRRRKSGRLYTWFTLAVVLGGAGLYYRVFWKPIRDASPGAGAAGSTPRLISERPEDSDLSGGPYANVPEHGNMPTSYPTTAPGKEDFTRALALMKTGWDAYDRGETIDARAKLSEALALGLPPEESVKTRAALGKLAEQTIFASTVVENDPLVSVYVIQPGDVLAKVAARYSITTALLKQINGLTDENRIRAGQRIKVVQGPFNAVVRRDTFDMDVYLQTTFVKHFKIGLGENYSTPPGKWRVHNKLVNPTYYPARGGDIITADDPKNPLGERWIGLEGLEGEAVGQERYGIHGTIEPESIGKNMSMGCVRMYNEDVAFVFDLLIEGKSTVTIR